ncbi:MAG TPA: hypothetical protein VK196_17260 [Magnetospirillum sp.]|nr:hypothetical protein [Magnetospirillum sp.]
MTSASPTPIESGGASWRAAFRPLGPVGAQGLTQACNLGGQLVAIAWVGHQAFGSVGLGLMVAATAVFVGDLGYGPWMLREVARDGHWLPEWRAATARRLLVLLPVTLLAAVAVGATAPDPSAGMAVVAAAAPGILLSAFLPGSVLYGLGWARAAALGHILRYAVQAVNLMLGAALGGDSFALMAGYGFTAGIVVQLLAGLAAGLPAAFLWPSWRAGLPPAPALRVWGLSLLGTLNDRALPLVVAVAMHGVLSWLLIAVQVLQGLAGMLAQVDRLVVPGVVRGHHGGIAPAALLTGTTAALAVAVGIAGALLQPGLIAPGWLMLAEWHCAMVGAWSFPVLFARDAERPLLLMIAVVLPVSLGLQALGAGRVALVWLLGVRVGAAAVIGRFSAVSAGMPALARWWPATALVAAALATLVVVPA